MRNSKVKQLFISGLFVLLNLCTPTAKAQYYSDEPTFFGGFILGTNFAQVDGDNFAGFRKIGLNGGAIVHTRIGEGFTASMELLYSQKGSIAGKNQVPIRYGPSRFLIEEYNIRITSASVPLSINYFFPDKRSIVSAGATYAYLVDATAVLNGVETIEQFPFKKHEVALQLGGSYRLWKKFYLNMRFQMSMLNIRKTYDPRAERAEQFNRMVSLRLMYLFKNND